MINWMLDNSLWLIGIGLMLASSGIDGAYMARWMTWAPLGYVLNTMSDIAGMVLTYWYGRLRQGPKTHKRMAMVLIGAEIVAVAYSWYFSYLQLRIVLVSVEGTSADAIAKIAAGFIPLLLAFVGYAQSALEGRLPPTRQTHRRAKSTAKAPIPPNTERTSKRGNGHEAHACPWCARSFGSKQAVSAHLRFCEAREPVEETA